MDNIALEKYRDAFVTLNEMSSHQEYKDMMISKGLVEIASKYLHSEMNEIRRESVLLLGSLFSVMRGREKANENTFSGLAKLLFESNLEIRFL